MIGYPIAWYGVLFAFGFWLAATLFSRFCSRYPIEGFCGKQLSEQIMNYMIVGIVLGARFFHLMFYESFDWIWTDPLRLVRFWEGGLASHGGIIGALVAGYIFAKRRHAPFLELADRAIVAALALAVAIRIGNFINQEILGVATHLPWGVIFIHPSSLFDGGMTARHPVQLYEALYYSYLLGVGCWFLSLRKPAGWTAAMVAIGIFSGRFLIEFFKEEQSVYLLHSSLNMGQWLSLPPLFGSILLLFWVMRYRAAR